MAEWPWPGIGSPRSGGPPPPTGLSHSRLFDRRLAINRPLLLGPHVDNCIVPRLLARGRGWGVFQTHFGNPQSFEIPAVRMAPYGEEYEEREPVWIWHAAFVSSVNPRLSSREGCAEYLARVCSLGRKFRVASVVVHTGAVSGVPIGTVMEGMSDFLNRLVAATPGDGPTVAVEHGASTCGFNLDPRVFATVWRGSPGGRVGWCVDLAHVYGAGCPWRILREAIEIYPPAVCHVNFPGSTFGSSRDIHGWRTLPQLVGGPRRSVDSRLDLTVEALVRDWDSIVRLLAGLGVPLIVEGSGFPGCDVFQEIETVRQIIEGDS